MEEKKKGNNLVWYILLGALAVIGLLYGDKEIDSTKETVETQKSERAADCYYSTAYIESQLKGTNETLQDRNVSGCFIHEPIPKSGGLMTIENTEAPRIRVTYFADEVSPSGESALRHLNVTIGDGDPVMWRANQGHEIFFINKPGRADFIFGDDKVKGRIVFQR
jgi:hypothetical protein